MRLTSVCILFYSIIFRLYSFLHFLKEQNINIINNGHLFFYFFWRGEGGAELIFSYGRSFDELWSDTSSFKDFTRDVFLFLILFVTNKLSSYKYDFKNDKKYFFIMLKNSPLRYNQR